MYLDRIILREPVDDDSYLSGLPVVQALTREREFRLHSNVTFLVGENGTGKSTLIEAVAVAFGFNPEGGSRNFSFNTRETHSELYRHITLSRLRYPKDGYFLRAESLYNVATNIDELDAGLGGNRIIDSYGGVSLHRQSHGESFLSLIQNRLGGHGLYILDEPEAALSPLKQMTLLTVIDQLTKNDSQFLIATHSPILMAMPGAEIFQLSDSGMETVSYEETEHFRLTRDFLNHPHQMLRYLLRE